jgi:hypothetical protein
MAVNLSPYGGVGAQFLDNAGNVLTGGKIFTYASGTTTPQITYVDSTGTTPHPNPIILDAAGRVPGGEIWLTDGLVYKFVLKDSNDVLIATYEGITGINSNFVAFTNQQEIQTATAGQTVFDLTTMSYSPGTNSLSVFVDGVNQYGPGAQYAYLETDSDTVTFVTGLHVGAEVKFTTSQLNSSASLNNAFAISYTPPFTSSVATNVGLKLAQTISVKDFGAVGDGVADDSAAIQAGIDAVGVNGGSLLFPPGTYKMSAQINVTNSNVALVGEKDAIIDFSDFTTVNPTNGFGSNIVLCFNIAGPGQSLTLTSTLTANAVLGAYSVTVSDGTKFADDDWVQITSNALVDSGTAVTVKQAEVLRVRSVVGNVVTFSTPLLNNYTTANSAKLTVVNYIENVSVNNLTFQGKNQSNLIQEGLRLNWCNNFNVTNCNFIGFDFMGLNIANSIIGDVNNNYCFGTLYTPFVGNSFYGINIYHSSQWVTVRANKGERVRHLIVSSGTSLQIGEPYFITITDNHTWDNMGGGAGSSFAYENHGFGRYMIWSQNTADGCYAGINLERGDQIVSDNYFRNIRFAGIIVGDNVTGPIDNVHITDNTISFLTTELLTSTRAGIQFTNTATQTRKNVKISNNKIEYFASSDVAWVSFGILVDGDAASGQGIVIDGNTIYTPTNNFVNHAAIAVDIQNVLVLNNVIFNYPRSILIDANGDGCVVSNNTINLETVPASSFAIYLLGNDCLVNNNIVRNGHTGVRADATGSIIKNNTFINCDTNINKAGSGTDAKIFGLGQLFASKTYDPSSVNDGSSITTTVTVTGAVVGQTVTPSFSLDLQGLVLTGYVSAADTVTTVLTNNTGSPVDLGSGTLTVSIQNAS